MEMGFIESLLHRGRSPEKVNEDCFQPTPPERSIIEAYLPEGRGGFNGFRQALGWAGISQERQRDLLEKYHTEKPKVMRPSGGNQNRA